MITTINEWKRGQNILIPKTTEIGEEFIIIQLNLNNVLTSEQIRQLKQVIQPEPGVNIRFINANSTITVNGVDYNKLRTIMDSIQNELKIILKTNSNFNENAEIDKNFIAELIMDDIQFYNTTIPITFDFLVQNLTDDEVKLYMELYNEMEEEGYNAGYNENFIINLLKRLNVYAVD